jgi:hypothetical protein
MDKRNIGNRHKEFDVGGIRLKAILPRNAGKRRPLFRDGDESNPIGMETGLLVEFRSLDQADPITGIEGAAVISAPALKPVISVTALPRGVGVAYQLRPGTVCP